eukprot:CAMPEP_0201651112 /NCGR_PEP_ID=MMETSP0493-20130528/42463_1 /ASSEMBLY_ACC=CAM_ASM_000838 /TAXON_ID=420259 /ORGANISM="Thalassiosira gravida, Strain GMp14c1" /LENGTH=264 /DNA_ID=CAMNT_0048127385 /DNA_START=83 /DNA_END=877 /DNA_ORIENTATION=-
MPHPHPSPRHVKDELLAKDRTNTAKIKGSICDTEKQAAPPLFIDIKKSTSLHHIMDGLFRNDSTAKVKIQKHVTMASPLPPRSKKSNKMPSAMHKQPSRPRFDSKGFLCDYSLGEPARCISHMIIQPTPDRAFHAVNLLKKHDFAFVKCSNNGRFRYAILAFRSLEPRAADNRIAASDSLEECMTFVMTDSGGIKMLKRELWAERIRLISVPEDHSSNVTRSVKHANDNPQKNETKDDWFLPSVISFVPGHSQFDDLSALDRFS